MVSSPASKITESMDSGLLASGTPQSSELVFGISPLRRLWLKRGLQLRPSYCHFLWEWPAVFLQEHAAVVQLPSHVQLPGTPRTAARQAALSFTISWSLLKLVSIEPMMPSNHLILYRPLLLLPPVFPSIRVFSKESVLLIRWPEYWSFNSNISPSNEQPGLISFRIDWLDLLAVQGTRKSLLQHHSSKASILWCSAFFIVQLSRPYMTTRKTISLTRQTFVSKVMSLLFNMLYRLATAFLRRRKHL